jgi:predicted RNA-binding Zn-ribbon protein involved in translation (DUF1610 family)
MTQHVSIARIAAVAVLLAAGLAALGVTGCQLFGKKPPPATEQTKVGGSKGKVGLAQGTQPTEPTEPTQPTTAGEAMIEIKAANPPAQGAAFKLFNDDGTVAEAGYVPSTCGGTSNARCKLIVYKDGYQNFESWEMLGPPDSVTEVGVVLEKIVPDRVAVVICRASGKRANRYCPRAVTESFSPSNVPGYCTIHGPKRAEVSVALCAVSKRRATRFCPSTANRRMPENAVPPYCNIHGPRQNEVSVALCADSGRRATQYCPNRVTRRLDPNQVPGYCNVHTGRKPDRTVSVTLCAVSKRRATQYCPSTISRRMDPDEVPGYCNTHTARRSGQSASSDDSSASSDEGQRATKTCPNCGTENRIRAQRCKNCRYHFRD